jgi:hypothetical protein
MKKRTGLSKTQANRYGGLIAVMCGRKPYQWLLDKLQEDEFIIIHSQSNSEEIIITEKGSNEFDRLTRLAGLPPLKDLEPLV